MGILLKDIPGLAEKVEAAGRQESELRELPFLGVNLEIRDPDGSWGIEVRQFTPRHFLLLDTAGNRFVRGGLITPEDVAQFLWVVSPGFAIGDDAAREKFVRSIRHLPFEGLSDQIEAYLDQAFLDRPAGGAGVEPVTSYLASLVHCLAFAYGWSRDVILDLPFAEVLQYWREIKRERKPDTAFANRLRDKARRESVAEYLKSQRKEQP